MSKFRLSLFAVLLASTASHAAAPPTPPADPDRFILLGNRFIWCELEFGSVVHIAPIIGVSKSLSTYLHLATIPSIQYHIAHDALWLVSRGSPFSGGSDAEEHMGKYPLKELEAKVRRDFLDPDRATNWKGPTFAYPTAGDLALRGGSGSEFSQHTYTDFLVTGSDSVRQFVLKNHGGMGFIRAEAGLLMASGSTYEGDRDTPFWTLKAYSYVARLDDDRKTYKRGRWELEASLPVAFREPFQLLTRGDDYYFITRSGKVYFCAKPPKGKEREMKCVWSDESRKVVGLVTDAKTGRSFLFCRAPAGERPGYFELDPEPRPVPYGAKAVEWPEYQPMTATGRAYARALIANGKVKLPAKPDGKK